MSSSRRGSCLCQEIEFIVSGEPEGVGACHCNGCSKNAGAPYQITARYEKSNVQIVKGEDKLGNYTITETTSGIEKHKIFSKCCGCTLWTIPMASGGSKFMIRTSLLDGGLTDLKPAAELFTKLSPSYLQPIEGAKQFEAYI